MDIPSRRILNYLIKQNKGVEARLYIDDYLKLHPDVKKLDLISNLNYLVDNKYLKTWADPRYDLFASKSSYWSPIHAGLHYRWKNYEEIKRFIFRSIFAPIVVALITSWLYVKLHLPM